MQASSVCGALGPSTGRDVALVVLGCRVGAGELSPAAERRVEASVAAWRRGAAAMVVAAGGRRWGEAIEAVELARALERRGVPRGVVELELASLSTLENARFSTEILRRHGIERALVVTCDWHAPRALRDFEAFGVRAAAVVAPSPALGHLARLRRDAREACSEALDARARARLGEVASRTGRAA